MSALKNNGNELYRYLVGDSMLVAVMSNGTRHCKYPEGTWKVYTTKKAEVPLDVWTKNKLAFRDKIAAVEPWRLKVTSLPTMRQIMKWIDEKGGCKTPTGAWVEPDGTGPDGAPSWAKLRGLI